MIDLSLEIDDRATARLKTASKEISASLAKALTRALLLLLGQIKREIVARTSDGNPRGSLMGSFQVELLSTSGEDLSGQAVSRLPYAGIQDRGGIVRPTKSKFLTVPVKGTPLGARARDFANLQFIPIKGRSPVLAEVTQTKRGKQKVKVRFVLKRSVNIPAKHYIEAARRVAGDQVISEFRRSIERALNA